MSSCSKNSNGENTCQACEAASTPATIYNAPNRTEIEHRVGEHATFKKTMLQQLSQSNELRGLSANSSQDHTVALLDASSLTLDILSFYQQQFANEHYLGTATERYSINEMAKSIGYQLSPGVAATGYLAFTMLDAPGSPTSAVIPLGSQVQSQPKANELPQIFETSEEFEAQVAWNAMSPVSGRWPVPSLGQKIFYLDGIATNLNPGDPVLIVSQDLDDDTDIATAFRRIASVSADIDNSVTKIKLGTGIGNAQLGDDAANRSYKLFALRQQAAVFGYNETEYEEKTDSNGNAYIVPKARTTFTTLSSPIALENAYKNIGIDSWVVFKKSGANISVTVDSIEDSIATNTVTSLKVSKLSVTVSDFTGYTNGNTTVYFQAEELAFAPKPLTADIDGQTFKISTDDSEFNEFHAIAIAGTDPTTGETVSEIAYIEEVVNAEDPLPDGSTQTLTTITLSEALSNTYERSSVSISGNVVEATHGQSRFEILGSGDGSQLNQEFTLKNSLLTYVPADTESGAASTLTIKVNDIEWDEANTHYGADSDESSYTVRQDESHIASIKFGDGIRGRRLPTGSNNITATYRQGIGLDGHLEKDQLNILLTRPLGLQSATNPCATFGAEDPEETEDARANAPLQVLTIDRIVSLKDFAYFANAFLGIAKATSKWIWNGQQRIVHLTVAASDGEVPTDDQIDLLSSAIDKRRDPFQPVEIDGYEPIAFRIEAKLWMDDAYDATLIGEKAIASLQKEYVFENRDFSQPVTAAEVIALLQAIDGVEGVDLNGLAYTDPTGRDNIDDAAKTTRLVARPARYESNDYFPAEILILDTDDDEAITIEIETAAS